MPGRRLPRRDVWKNDSELAGLIARAKTGDVNAQIALGLKYRDNFGPNADYDQAMKWFQRAAEQGNIRARFLACATLHAVSPGLAADDNNLLAQTALTAAYGEINAGLLLVFLKLFRGTSQDSSAVLKENIDLRTADAETLFRLAVNHWFTNFPDDGIFGRYITGAIAKGSSQAKLFNDSLPYIFGAQTDPRGCVGVLERYVKFNVPEAALHIARAYSPGGAMPLNRREATRWFRVAESLGYKDPASEVITGHMLRGRASAQESVPFRAKSTDKAPTATPAVSSPKRPLPPDNDNEFNISALRFYAASTDLPCPACGQMITPLCILVPAYHEQRSFGRWNAIGIPVMLFDVSVISAEAQEALTAVFPDYKVALPKRSCDVHMANHCPHCRKSIPDSYLQVDLGSPFNPATMDGCERTIKLLCFSVPLKAHASYTKRPAQLAFERGMPCDRNGLSVAEIEPNVLSDIHWQ
jgi:TPR repeat protein